MQPGLKAFRCAPEVKVDVCFLSRNIMNESLAKSVAQFHRVNSIRLLQSYVELIEFESQAFLLPPLKRIVSSN